MVSGFLQEDIFNFKEDTGPLIEKLLLLEYVVFSTVTEWKTCYEDAKPSTERSDSSDKKVNAVLLIPI